MVAFLLLKGIHLGTCFFVSSFIIALYMARSLSSTPARDFWMISLKSIVLNCLISLNTLFKQVNFFTMSLGVNSYNFSYLSSESWFMLGSICFDDFKLGSLKDSKGNAFYWFWFFDSYELLKDWKYWSWLFSLLFFELSSLSYS